MSNKFFKSWSFYERVLRVLEVIFIALAALVILQIPRQIREWEYSQENRSLDVLFRLEDRMLNKTNQQIFITIENGGPLLKPPGKFTSDELDLYLDDLMSIEDAYSRNLIDIESTYSWFYDYFYFTSRNPEIKEYLKIIREKNSDYYGVFEEIVEKLEEYRKK